MGFNAHYREEDLVLIVPFAEESHLVIRHSGQVVVHVVGFEDGEIFDTFVCVIRMPDEHVGKPRKRRRRR